MNHHQILKFHRCEDWNQSCSLIFLSLKYVIDSEIWFQKVNLFFWIPLINSKFNKIFSIISDTALLLAGSCCIIFQYSESADQSLVSHWSGKGNLLQNKVWKQKNCLLHLTLKLFVNSLLTLKWTLLTCLTHNLHITQKHIQGLMY